MKSPYNGQTLPSQGAICQINGATDGRALIDSEAGTERDSSGNVALSTYNNLGQFRSSVRETYSDLDKKC